jgi:hypothetical protein
MIVLSLNHENHKQWPTSFPYQLRCSLRNNYKGMKFDPTFKDLFLVIFIMTYVGNLDEDLRD